VGEISTRREAMLRAAALLAMNSIARTSTARAEDKAEPSHDPSYSVLPTRAELVKSLESAARKAQETSRLIDGISVTGLPAAVLEIDRQIVGAMKSSGIPGVALGIAKHKNMVISRGYGKASLVGNVPVEPTTPGGWMSISKTLTVTAALTLVRDRKLHIDDRASRILTDAPLLGEGQSADHRRAEITVRHLMSHRSGLFNVVEVLNDPERFQALARQGQLRLVHDRITQADLVRIGWKEPLLFEPGTKFAYSGQGMQVLARIVEKLSGQRLDRYIQKRIFEPLGIRSYYVGSYLADEPFQRLMEADREHTYNMCPCSYDGDTRRHAPRNEAQLPYRSWGEADACGWACTHVLDLLRYACFLPEVIGTELMRLVTIRPTVIDDKGQRAPSPMGLGWGVYDRAENELNYVGIQHNGAWPGQRSYVELRSNGCAYALQFNSENDDAVGDVIHTASLFVDRLASTVAPVIDWKEYGYGSPHAIVH
jgi:CubicO group peptidase (beta-lactamase class C family)